MISHSTNIFKSNEIKQTTMTLIHPSWVKHITKGTKVKLPLHL